MKLVLINGERIEITRHTCGFDSKGSPDYDWHRTWNIDPVNCLAEWKKYETTIASGFVIGKWGTGAEKPVDKFIPIQSVLYIEDTGEWEDEL